MRLPLACFALLFGCTVSGLPVNAQDLGSQTANKATSASATEAEVNELRKEVAAQRQTIQQLQTMVGKLAEANAANLQTNAASLHVVTDSAAPATGAQLVNAVIVQPDPDGSDVIVEQSPASAPKGSKSPSRNEPGKRAAVSAYATGREWPRARSRTK